MMSATNNSLGRTASQLVPRAARDAMCLRVCARPPFRSLPGVVAVLRCGWAAAL